MNRIENSPQGAGFFPDAHDPGKAGAEPAAPGQAMGAGSSTTGRHVARAAPCRLDKVNRAAGLPAADAPPRPAPHAGTPAAAPATTAAAPRSETHWDLALLRAAEEDLHARHLIDPWVWRDQDIIDACDPILDEQEDRNARHLIDPRFWRDQDIIDACDPILDEDGPFFAPLARAPQRPDPEDR